MKKYKEIIKNDDKLQNTLALYVLIDHGKLNLLDKEYIESLYDDIESGKSKNSFMTNEYQKRILDVSAEMAKLEHNDLLDFIQNEIDLSNKYLDKDDDLHDYDY